MVSTFDCWEILGLPAGSDERSIKRQYARQLKTTRPDEDPVAFQRLREAYEQALQIMRDGGLDESEQAAADFMAEPFVVRSHPHEPLNPTPSPYEQAVELFSRFDDADVEQYWDTASAKGCGPEFERLLFQRCADDPEAHTALLTWGLEKRQWLTPWQQIIGGEFQQQRLAFALTTVLYNRLDQHMAAGEDAYFFDCLEQHSRQGWLSDFSRRQALQVHVLNLFLNTESWSPALFQRVCQLFGWDDEAAVVPIADKSWQYLRRRCEQQAWLNELRSLMQLREQQPSARANAATLFLLCTAPAKQAQLAADFGEEDWHACEQLSEIFASQYPDLLGIFPNHNPRFWKALVVQKAPPYGLKRSACVITLGLILNSMDQPDFMFTVTIILLPLYIAGGVLAAYVGKWLLSHWASLTQYLYDVDLQISLWCVRHNLIKDRRYLVIRNSGGYLALGFLIWKLLGILGLAAYVLTGAIGLLRFAGAAPADRQYRWRKPLQAIYRIAGLSPLQWLFGVSMLCVIGYVQLHMPGTVLTKS